MKRRQEPRQLSQSTLNLWSKAERRTTGIGDVESIEVEREVNEAIPVTTTADFASSTSASWTHSYSCCCFGSIMWQMLDSAVALIIQSCCV